MFPFSFRGAVDVNVPNQSEADRFLDQLQAALPGAGGRKIRRVGNTITFRGHKSGRNWDFNDLDNLGDSEIEVVVGNPGFARYSSSTKEMCLMITLVMLLPGYALLGSLGNFVKSFALAVIFWLTLFGSYYLLAAMRLSNFIRDVVVQNKISRG